MVLADRMLQMRTVAPAEDPRPATLDRGRAAVRRRRHEGDRPGDRDEARRQGAQVEVDGRSTGLDVRDDAAVASHVDAAAARIGGLDHVIVTAGVLRIGPVMRDRTGRPRRDHRREPDRHAQRGPSGVSAPVCEPRIADRLRVELVHARPARLRGLLGEQGRGRQPRPGPGRGVARRRRPRQRGQSGAHRHADAPARLPGRSRRSGCSRPRRSRRPRFG